MADVKYNSDSTRKDGKWIVNVRERTGSEGGVCRISLAYQYLFTITNSLLTLDEFKTSQLINLQNRAEIRRVIRKMRREANTRNKGISSLKRIVESFK